MLGGKFWVERRGIFGFNNTIRYKDFTLSFAIDGRIGGVAHSVMDQALWMTGAHMDSDTQWRYDEVVNERIHIQKRSILEKGLGIIRI